MTETPAVDRPDATLTTSPPPSTPPPATARHLVRVALGAAAVTAAGLGIVVAVGVVPLGDAGPSVDGASISSGAGDVPALPASLPNAVPPPVASSTGITTTRGTTEAAVDPTGSTGAPVAPVAGAPPAPRLPVERAQPRIAPPPARPAAPAPAEPADPGPSDPGPSDPPDDGPSTPSDPEPTTGPTTGPTSPTDPEPTTGPSSPPSSPGTGTSGVTPAP